MGAVLTVRTLLVASVVVTAIAGIDAAIGGSWDLVAVTTLALGLQVAALGGVTRRRHHVHLRADLAGWVNDRAAKTGESVDAVVDRALSDFASRVVAPPATGRHARRE
ncbi:MAG TPA: hypothetical protein VLA09_12940 [Longimicrobiales bacterium]|nr:hypothetical protein [Longimicrobiales bacterium]